MATKENDSGLEKEETPPHGTAQGTYYNNKLKGF